MDLATLFHEAHTARARCAAGGFVLMGQPLRALTARRLTILEALLGPVIYTDGLDLADFAVIADVCASPDPTGVFRDRTDAEVDAELARWNAGGFTVENQSAVWCDYLDACYASRPPLKKLIGGQAADTQVPLFSYIIAAILAESSGYIRAELWDVLPVSELFWCYEAMREQRDGCSYIARDTSDDPTPEHMAKVDAIMAAHFAALENAKSAEQAAAADAARDKALRELEGVPE